MIALFYKPPCGQWYVHSHKLYSSYQEAKEAAAKFLHPETPICCLAINEDVLDACQVRIPR